MPILFFFGGKNAKNFARSHRCECFFFVSFYVNTRVRHTWHSRNHRLPLYNLVFIVISFIYYNMHVEMNFPHVLILFHILTAICVDALFWMNFRFSHQIPAIRLINFQNLLFSRHISIKMALDWYNCIPFSSCVCYPCQHHMSLSISIFIKSNFDWIDLSLLLCKKPTNRIDLL